MNLSIIADFSYASRRYSGRSVPSVLILFLIILALWFCILKYANQKTSNIVSKLNLDKSEKDQYHESSKEIADQIARCATQADFTKMIADLPNRKGIWKNDDQIVGSLNRLFEAWFSMDVNEAIKGVSMIPENRHFPLSTETLRSAALADGGKKQFMDSPTEFVKAANDLLPEQSASNVTGYIFSYISNIDPQYMFEFIERDLGQGRDKSRALQELFSVWSKKDLPTALDRMANLEFEEDKQVAYETIANIDIDWSIDNIKQAEIVRMPIKYINTIRSRQDGRDNYRKRTGGDPPRDQ